MTKILVFGLLFVLIVSGLATYKVYLDHRANVYPRWFTYIFMFAFAGTGLIGSAWVLVHYIVELG